MRKAGRQFTSFRRVVRLTRLHKKTLFGCRRGRVGFVDRNNGGNNRSFLARREFELPSDLAHALAHPAQSNTECAHPVRSPVYPLFRLRSLSLVNYLEDHGLVLSQQSNSCRGTSRVPVYVG